MKHTLFVVLFAVISTAVATANVVPEKAIVRPAKIDPRLRSAFLLRAVGPPEEYRLADENGLRTQIQAHFNAVLTVLEANRNRSLEIALARLEQRQGVRWNETQRRYWHHYLNQQRDQNVQRLIAYRDRGLFPLNEGHATEGAPIFVDNHDTACAVGHLMRESGWEREVNVIAATNLLVYVTDVSSGPLVDWVLQSGLTLGEVALIQPQYSPPIAEIPMNILSGSGAGFNAPATFFNGVSEQTIPNGLRYEDFTWRSLPNVPLDTNIPINQWSAQAPSNIGVRTDYDVIYGRDDCGGFCFVDYYAAWPYANLLSVAPDSESFSIGSGLNAFAMSFDIVANHPALAIDRVGIFPAEGFNGPFGVGVVEAWSYVTTERKFVNVVSFPSQQGGAVTTQVSIIAPGVVLDGLYANVDWNPASPPSGPNEDSVIFSPLKRVTVHSYILVRPDSDFGALSHEVRLVSLVPEPTSFASFLGFVAIGVICRRHR